jgi:hypothetical protein
MGGGPRVSASCSQQSCDWRQAKDEPPPPDAPILPASSGAGYLAGLRGGSEDATPGRLRAAYGTSSARLSTRRTGPRAIGRVLPVCGPALPTHRGSRRLAGKTRRPATVLTLRALDAHAEGRRDSRANHGGRRKKLNLDDGCEPTLGRTRRSGGCAPMADRYAEPASGMSTAWIAVGERHSRQPLGGMRRAAGYGLQCTPRGATSVSRAHPDHCHPPRNRGRCACRHEPNRPRRVGAGIGSATVWDRGRQPGAWPWPRW